MPTGFLIMLNAQDIAQLFQFKTNQLVAAMDAQWVTVGKGKDGEKGRKFKLSDDGKILAGGSPAMRGKTFAEAFRTEKNGLASDIAQAAVKKHGKGTVGEYLRGGAKEQAGKLESDLAKAEKTSKYYEDLTHGDFRYRDNSILKPYNKSLNDRERIANEIEGYREAAKPESTQSPIDSQPEQQSQSSKIPKGKENTYNMLKSSIEEHPERLRQYEAEKQKYATDLKKYESDLAQYNKEKEEIKADYDKRYSAYGRKWLELADNPKYQYDSGEGGYGGVPLSEQKRKDTLRKKEAARGTISPSIKESKKPIEPQEPKHPFEYFDKDVVSAYKEIHGEPEQQSQSAEFTDADIYAPLPEPKRYALKETNSGKKSYRIRGKEIPFNTDLSKEYIVSKEGDNEYFLRDSEGQVLRDNAEAPSALSFKTENAANHFNDIMKDIAKDNQDSRQFLKTTDSRPLILMDIAMVFCKGICEAHLRLDKIEGKPLC